MERLVDKFIKALPETYIVNKIEAEKSEWFDEFWVVNWNWNSEKQLCMTFTISKTGDRQVTITDTSTDIGEIHRILKKIDQEINLKIT